MLTQSEVIGGIHPSSGPQREARQKAQDDLAAFLTRLEVEQRPTSPPDRAGALTPASA